MTTQTKDNLRQWLPISLILLVAVGLYCYQLGTESLWYDENFSINKTLKGIYLPPQNLTRPFYFMLLYGWMQISSNTLWLRGLSVIFGIISVLLIYLLGRRVANEAVGLIAALTLTLSPLFINHAQEVRMYTLIPCLSLAGTLALVYALESPTAKAINAWAIARLLGFFTSPITLPLALPDVALIVWQFRHQRRRWFAFILRILFVAAVWLPCAVAVKTNSSGFVQGWAAQYPKPNLILIVAELTHLTAFWPLRHLLGSGISANELMRQVNEQPLLDWLFNEVFSSNLVSLIYYMAYTVMVTILLAIALFTRYPNMRLWWVRVWALIPIGSILAISYASSSIWRARYLLFASPYCLILLAAGFWQVWRWRRWLGIIIAVVYAVAVAGGLIHYYTTLYRAFDGAPT